MGAWSYEPTGNDEALEWISNSITRPLLEAISSAIDRFLEDGSDDVRKIEAEVAVALLLDLTGDSPGVRYLRFDFNSIAREQGLWERAVTAIHRLQSNTEWLSGWNVPQQKVDVLSRLLAAIEVSKNRPADYGAFDVGM